MPKGLIFLCCACCILVLTIVNLSIGPIISKKVGGGADWGLLNCARTKDDHEENKKTMSGDTLKYHSKWYVDECIRKKGMHDMEYTAFIFDIVIGFVCGLLGLLHFFDLKKDFVEKTGLIGLICGGVGFVLTFVYVIFNGLVYTKYYDNRISKTNGDGAFAEWKGDKYECLYFDKTDNFHALIAKYSDLGKKQYNYNKDFQKSLREDRSVSGCSGISGGSPFSPLTICGNDGTISGPLHYTDDSGASKDCKFLYTYGSYQQYTTNKDLSDRFLTTLILSLVVCLGNIGLALFGFLMAKSGEFN